MSYRSETANESIRSGDGGGHSITRPNDFESDERGIDTPRIRQGQVESRKHPFTGRKTCAFTSARIQYLIGFIFSLSEAKLAACDTAGEFIFTPFTGTRPINCQALRAG
jgi:hypothetical protein